MGNIRQILVKYKTKLVHIKIHRANGGNVNQSDQSMVTRLDKTRI